ncbi:MAG: 2-succinyl-5-enolpyruvyl-6-hydroxy-3-cyclohexene-1-carboxylate synthase, partial [Lentisphaerae bacterium]|nr:2-succinyl-5-enolpyruvyl-6-hydroxy-3-cyclohexene-1-carboxylate synthase [Lentisphaerota bacterium]
MPEKMYTDQKNAQIVLALLKAHGIRKVIASPGTTNIPITGSIQNDPFFEVWSAADERSAAYMACGLASASGEAVVISCTAATASRN